MNAATMRDSNSTLIDAAEALRRARSLLVLTGAGISAESGIPTYRGSGGVYAVDPSLMDTLSAAGFAARPEDVWDYVDGLRRTVAEARPNRAHEVLAGWEREGRFDRFLIATQNVDGLHQAAGSDRVTEMHGSIWRLSAPREAQEEEPEDLSEFFRAGDREALLRKWSRDNERMVWENREVPFRDIPPSPEPGVRPDVVLFGELYENRLLWVEHFIDRGVDAVLVIGCSGSVHVLFALLHRVLAVNPRATIVNVNPEEDCVESDHIFVRQAAGDALAALDETLRRD